MDKKRRNFTKRSLSPHLLSRCVISLVLKSCPSESEESKRRFDDCTAFPYICFDTKYHVWP